MAQYLTYFSTNYAVFLTKNNMMAGAIQGTNTKPAGRELRIPPGIPPCYPFPATAAAMPFPKDFNIFLHHKKKT